MLKLSCSRSTLPLYKIDGSGGYLPPRKTFFKEVVLIFFFASFLYMSRRLRKKGGMSMDNITLILIAIIAINIRLMVTKICDTIINIRQSKKELTAQSNKRRG